MLFLSSLFPSPNTYIGRLETPRSLLFNQRGRGFVLHTGSILVFAGIARTSTSLLSNCSPLSAPLWLSCALSVFTKWDPTTAAAQREENSSRKRSLINLSLCLYIIAWGETTARSELIDMWHTEVFTEQHSCFVRPAPSFSLFINETVCLAAESSFLAACN